jgi:hypothetical protein
MHGECYSLDYHLLICWPSTPSPGRFFAVNEQKVIMSHVIMTYDFKLKDGVRPEDEWVAMIGGANSTAEVMFRRRN